MRFLCDLVNFLQTQKHLQSSNLTVDFVIQKAPESKVEKSESKKKEVKLKILKVLEKKYFLESLLFFKYSKFHRRT